MRMMSVVFVAVTTCWGCGAKPPPPPPPPPPAPVVEAPPAANPDENTVIDPSVNPEAGKLKTEAPPTGDSN